MSGGEVRPASADSRTEEKSLFAATDLLQYAESGVESSGNIITGDDTWI
jgi:hypothetical protein